MVVSESGLMAAMKKAWKKEGYKVAGIDRAGFEEIMIGTGEWVVVITKKNVPRKVLGLIAEHLGQIPVAGEAFHLRNGDTQTEIYHVAMQLIEAMGNGEKPRSRAMPTSLTMGGRRLWQRKDDMAVFSIPPEREAIMLSHGRNVLMFADELLMVDGNVSRVYVRVRTTKPTESAVLEHLGKIQWVSFEKEKKS